jgi:hypothetical protein
MAQAFSSAINDSVKDLPRLPTFTTFFLYTLTGD